MCKTEVADSAFADCRRLSDIEYGQWDFSDTEDIYISDAPMWIVNTFSDKFF